MCCTALAELLDDAIIELSYQMIKVHLKYFYIQSYDSIFFTITFLDFFFLMNFIID